MTRPLVAIERDIKGLFERSRHSVAQAVTLHARVAATLNRAKAACRQADRLMSADDAPRPKPPVEKA